MGAGDSKWAGAVQKAMTPVKTEPEAAHALVQDEIPEHGVQPETTRQQVPRGVLKRIVWTCAVDPQVPPILKKMAADLTHKTRRRVTQADLVEEALYEYLEKHGRLPKRRGAA